MLTAGMHSEADMNIIEGFSSQLRTGLHFIFIYFIRKDIIQKCLTNIWANEICFCTGVTNVGQQEPLNDNDIQLKSDLIADQHWYVIHKLIGKKNRN